MCFFDLIGLILLISTSYIYITFVTELSELETNTVNPRDQCRKFQKFVLPLQLQHTYIFIVLFCSAFYSKYSIFFKSICFFYHLYLVIYYYIRTKNHQLFEPLTIIRNAQSLLILFICFLVGNILTFAVMLVFMLIQMLDNFKT